MVDTAGSILQRSPVLATAHRWDLKDAKAYPIWEEDFDRLVRRACGSKFLGSTKPSLEDVAAIVNVSAPDTRSGKAIQLNLEEAQAAIQQWEALDESLFDMAMASVTMSEAELTFVKANFKPTLAGNALVAWIKAKASKTSASGQMELKQTLAQLTIGTTASSADIGKVLDDISTIWPKIASKQSPTAMTESIEYALSKIPSTHPVSKLVDTIQTNMSMGVQGTWESYADFQERLMEQIKKKELSLGGFGSGSPGAVLPVDGQDAWRKQRTLRKPKKEQKPTGCTKCPMFNCGPTDCVVFGAKTLDQITGSDKQKRLIKALRAFVQKTRCTQILTSDMMEKASPVRKFIATYAAEQRDQSRASKGAGLILDGPSEVPENDDNFWEMLANNQHNLVLAGVCMQPEDCELEADADLHATDSDYETELVGTIPTAPIDSRPEPRLASPSDDRPSTPPIKPLPASTAQTQQQPPPSATPLPTPVRFAGFSEGAGISSFSRVSTPAAHLERILEVQSRLQSPDSRDDAESARSVHAAQLTNKLSEENEVLKDELERVRSTARREGQAAHAKVKSLQQLRSAAESALAAAGRVNNQLSNNVNSLTSVITAMRSATKIDTGSDKSLEPDASDQLAKSRTELSLAQDRLSIIGQLTKQRVHTKPNKTVALALTAVTAYVIARLRAPKVTATLTMLSARLLRFLANLAIAARAPAGALLSSIAAILSARLQAHAPSVIAPPAAPLPEWEEPSYHVHAAFMLAHGSKKATSAAILYDTGCSTLMTNDLAGAVGSVRKIQSAAFTTAVGLASFDQVVRKRRTMWGVNGQSYTFEADWMLNPRLPYDVIGPGPLRKTASLIYVDADPDVPSSLPRIELRKPGKTLSMARTPNGLEWLSWHRPLDSRASAVALVALSETKFETCTTQPPHTPSPDKEIEKTTAPTASNVQDDDADGEFGPFNSSIPDEFGPFVSSVPTDTSNIIVPSFTAAAASTGISTNDTNAEDDVALPLNSAGAGMGKLKESLTDLEKVILTHCRLGHASLRRLSDSSHHTTGGMQLKKEALLEFAKRGCDVCNAYKIKLVQPKEKHHKISIAKPSPKLQSTDSETAEERVVVITVDEFGKVSVASAGDGFHYAVLFVWAERHIGWLFGAKTLDAGTIASLWKRFEAKFSSWFPGIKIKIVRMDSLATHKSAEMLKVLEEGMVNPQFSPPGQHAMLQAAERYFYILVVCALILMRHGGAPMSMWFDAMVNALDIENTLASKLGWTADDLVKSLTGYERALGKVPNISDIYSFYAPGRFAIDEGQLPGKWAERSRAGFWLHRDTEWVMTGKKGSAIFWDGNKKRTVVQLFYVQEGGFLDTIAPDNKLLPNFPRDANPMPSVTISAPTPSPSTITSADGTTIDTSVVPAPAPAKPTRPSPQAVPLSVVRPRRDGAVRSYDDDTKYDALFHCGSNCGLCGNANVVSGECPDCETTWDVSLAVNAVDAKSKELSAILPPSADIVLNLCGGDYSADDSVSSFLRAASIGVIDCDNHPEYGGGRLADLNSNAVFTFIDMLVDAQRIALIIEHQPCHSGSVARFRADHESDVPEVSRDQQEPNGKSGLSSGYAKEIHDAELLSFRITHLVRKAVAYGAKFIGECPSVRGDPQRAVAFDPAFAMHASVKCSSAWKQLRGDIRAFVVTMASCKLREGYAQKLEDIMISADLPDLARVLSTLVCDHPPGTHVNSFGGAKFGKWNIASSQKWLPEFSRLLADHVIPLLPKGGPSLKLGVDDVPAFVENGLKWRDAKYLDVLRANASRHVPPGITASTLAILDGLDDISPTVGLPHDDDHDIDPRLEKAPVFFIERGATSVGNCFLLEDWTDIAFEWGGFCLVVDDTTEALQTKWIALQTEKALKACPQQLAWLASDQTEIDTLWGPPYEAFEEELESNVPPEQRDRYYRTKFVRVVKTDPISSKTKPRSRLVCVGTGQEEGREYRRKEVPTPCWSTILILIGECTVAHGLDFQFDLSQYFQQTPCETPDGTLLLIPPPRYQRRDNGVRVLWKAKKWLQGAKGAGYEARQKFNALVTNNGKLNFEISDWDPSLYFKSFSDGHKIRFALHGDDGCGGWATKQSLIDDLVGILEPVYGSVKIGPWNTMLGFEVTRDKPAGKTKVTAKQAIANLEKYVATDCHFSPKLPYSKAINELQLGDTFEPGSPDYADQQLDVEWMRASLGALQHVTKTRKDCSQAINRESRYSHKPCKQAVKCVKHTIFYLLAHRDDGLIFGSGPASKWEDLIWSKGLPSDYKFDPNVKLMGYHMACDGNLEVDRSTSGIVQMFAGANIAGSSFRQHSQAVEAHGSELFTASTAAAFCVPTRGILTELGIAQLYPTPLFIDSASTVLCAESRLALKRSMHLMRRAKYLQESVEEEVTKPISIGGTLNFADPFTKAILVIKDFLAHKRYYMGEN